MTSQERLERVVRRAASAVGQESAELLKPLTEYDTAHAGDLVHTLQVYLHCGCNASKTAETLYLHRSGLLYRLRRIEDLLSVQLDVFEVRLALELAIAARDLAGA